MGYKGRDVEVVPLEGGKCLVVGCDSCGAIGSKAMDSVKVPNYIVGRLTTRLVLLEVLSAGAAPRAITASICCEPDPTGKEILQGVRDELGSLGITSLPLVISSEKNMTTVQTGLGISIVGICDTQQLTVGTLKRGDLVYCLGLPKVGVEVQSPDDPEIVTGGQVRHLLNIPGIHDIVPVGSRGIRREAFDMAASVEASFELENEAGIDVCKSAGPSTCVIFACSPEAVLPDFTSTPINKIGRII